MVWDPVKTSRIFGTATNQLFRSGEAHFICCRSPDCCCRVLGALHAVPAIFCVDDVLVAERAATATSAFVSWRLLASLVGYDGLDSKSPPPASSFRASGALCGFSAFSGSPLLLRPALDHVEKLTASLEFVLAGHSSELALAGHLLGKSNCMSSHFFRKCRKSVLRAFSRRQHYFSSVSLITQLEYACRF